MALDLALHRLAANLLYLRTTGTHDAHSAVALLRVQLAATALARSAGADDPTNIASRVDGLADQVLAQLTEASTHTLPALITEICDDLHIVGQRLGKVDEPEWQGLLPG
jgi:hypothetical protein